MKGELFLHNDKDITDSPVTVTSCEFGISLYIDPSKRLEGQIFNKNKLSKKFDELIWVFSVNDEGLEEPYKKAKEDIDNFYDNIEFIRLGLEDIDILEFIEQNPIIKTKKIVLSEFITMKDIDKVIYFLKKYDKYKDNIYVSMANNGMEYISLVDCFETMNQVKNIADSILSLNLSPMETIMYTYDLVRNRVYKEEDIDDSPTLSRSLNSVMRSDKIVCVGYSNIFSALLYYMNIDCWCINLIDEVNFLGHTRNLVYVKDEKYNIDGAYYFDVTWDSKKENENNEFLYRYPFFAKTRAQMEEYEKGKYKYDECPYYSNNMVEEIKKLLDNENLDKINIEYARSLNFMSRLCDKKTLIDRLCLIELSPKYNQFDRKDLLDRLSVIQNKFNNPISAETFIMLLKNVRKIQYYQNPEFYPYGLDELYKTYLYSGWEFESHHYDSLLKFLFMISGEDFESERNVKKDDFVNFAREEKVFEEIKGVQLTKVLKSIALKK